jgi:hypothetical protein
MATKQVCFQKRKAGFLKRSERGGKANMIRMPTKRPFIWKQFFTVWMISFLAILLVLPYSLGLAPEAIEAAGGVTAVVL